MLMPQKLRTKKIENGLIYGGNCMADKRKTAEFLPSLPNAHRASTHLSNKELK